MLGIKMFHRNSEGMKCSICIYRGFGLSAYAGYIKHLGLMQLNPYALLVLNNNYFYEYQMSSVCSPLDLFIIFAFVS